MSTSLKITYKPSLILSTFPQTSHTAIRHTMMLTRTLTSPIPKSATESAMESEMESDLSETEASSFTSRLPAIFPTAM